MIFVILGTQKHQFDRLLKQIDVLVEKNVIRDEVFAQIGNSSYTPVNYGFKRFLSKLEFDEIIKKSSLVLTHAGTGSIMTALKYEKIVIAVPRLSKYNEHVDDHQIQIIDQLGDMGVIIPCRELEKLEEVYLNSQKDVLKKYVSNRDEMIDDIDKFICDLFSL